MGNRELNNVKINVQFLETVNRQQISSGDEIKTLFGKIKKWLSDLKTVAFTGSYNDLLDKPTIPTSYIHPSTSGNKHIPSGGSSGQILRWSANGTAVWGADNANYSVATTSTNGLMSSNDKMKLDGIATSANKTTVDSTMSSTSTNPVQNKVIYSAIEELKKSVADGKKILANTISNCGVTAASTESFSDLSNKISTLSNNKYNEGYSEGQSSLEVRDYIVNVSYTSNPETVSFVELDAQTMPFKEHYIIIFDFGADKTIIDSMNNTGMVISVNNNFSVKCNGNNTDSITFILKKMVSISCIVTVITWENTARGTSSLDISDFVKLT